MSAFLNSHRLCGKRFLVSKHLFKASLKRRVGILLQGGTYLINQSCLGEQNFSLYFPFFLSGCLARSHLGHILYIAAGPETISTTMPRVPQPTKGIALKSLATVGDKKKKSFTPPQSKQPEWEAELMKLVISTSEPDSFKFTVTSDLDFVFLHEK